jgi:hypothetical protein
MCNMTKRLKNVVKRLKRPDERRVGTRQSYPQPHLVKFAMALMAYKNSIMFHGQCLKTHEATGEEVIRRGGTICLCS